MLLRYLRYVTRLKLLNMKSGFINILPYVERVKQERRQKNNLRKEQLKSRIQHQMIKELYGRHATGVMFETFNGIMVNSLTDVVINGSLGFAGSYDKIKLTHLLDGIASDWCVYIVGAHIGTLVVPIAQKARKVIAFEANPVTHRFLCWNMQLNERNNVQVFNCALYNEAVELEFYLNKANSGGSKIKPVTDNFRYNYDHPDTVSIQGKRLDDMVREHDLEWPDLVMMDIEGAEYGAIQGAAACLRHARVLYIEFAPAHLKEVANISVADFVNAITIYFPYMLIAQLYLTLKGKYYSGGEIMDILQEYFRKEIPIDLIFLKEKPDF